MIVTQIERSKEDRQYYRTHYHANPKTGKLQEVRSTKISFDDVLKEMVALSQKIDENRGTK